MTILEHIVWLLTQDMIQIAQHTFHTDGLLFWCQKPARVFDPQHGQRLLHLNCFVNGVTGWAHPAGR